MSRGTRGAIYAVLAAAGLFWSWLFARFTIDDAFITWRYGRTLVETGQWNWQPDTARVEAYTNPAYAFLGIVPPWLGLSSEVFFKGVSVVLLGVLVAFLLRLGLPPWQRLTALALVALSPVFWIHLWSGLETPLFVVGIVVAYGLLHRRGRLGAAGLLAVVLLGLSRPEGLGFAVAAMGWSHLLQRTRRSLAEAVLVVGGFVVYWLARWWYFGAFFPNTFYVKTANAAGDSGLARVALATGVGLLVVGGTALVGEALRRAGAGAEATRVREAGLAPWTPVFLAALACGVAVVVYGTSTLTMDFANRFRWQLVQPVVLVCLAAPVTAANRRQVALALAGAAGITLVGPLYLDTTVTAWVAVAGVLLAALLWWGRRHRALLAATAATAAAAASLTTLDGVLVTANYTQRLENAHGNLGRALHEAAPDGGTLVMGDVGLAPLESRWRTLDLFGLANREIALEGEIMPVMQAWDPDVVVLTSDEPRLTIDPTEPARRVVPARFARSRGYEFLGSATFRPDYHLLVYGRPGLDPAVADGLREAVAASAPNDASEAEFFAGHPFAFPFLAGADR